MSGQQYQQLLQQSPYYSQVQNSPYVQPYQLPPVQSDWGEMARAAFSAPPTQEMVQPKPVMGQQQNIRGLPWGLNR